MTEKADEVEREEPHYEPNEGASDTGIPDREDAPTEGTNGASRDSGGESSHKDKVPLFNKDGFQWVVAAVLIVITGALSGAMFKLVSNAGVGAVGSPWSMAFFTVLMGLFGVLITGLFVFMAFRIDHGAKLEAQRIAMEAAQKAAEEARSAARKRAEEVAAERAQEVAAEKAAEVAAEIAERAAERAKKVAAKKAEQAAEEAKKAAVDRAEELVAHEVQKVATEVFSSKMGELGETVRTMARALEDFIRRSGYDK